MHVLVGRGGELVAPCGLVCDNPDCACRTSLTALDSRAPVQVATVAERPEVTQAALITAYADFLAGLSDDAATVDACAQDMAATAIEAAAGWPPGTTLTASYQLDDDATDHFDGGWTFTLQQ